MVMDMISVIHMFLDVSGTSGAFKDLDCYLHNKYDYYSWAISSNYEDLAVVVTSVNW